jgi:hypothetical protein
VGQGVASWAGPGLRSDGKTQAVSRRGCDPRSGGTASPRPSNAIAVPRESKTCAECPDGDFGPYWSALCRRTVKPEAYIKRIAREVAAIVADERLRRDDGNLGP